MKISFEATIDEINSWFIIQLPIEFSKQLPSRGMVFIQATLYDKTFQVPLEPDGRGSHWFKVPDTLSNVNKVLEGETAILCIEVLENWPSPELPDDFNEALIQSDLKLRWEILTAKSQWEWLRWIRSTTNSETRQKRIQLACTKLINGNKRPCCFDTSRCTVPEISKSGVLLSARI